MEKYSKSVPSTRLLLLLGLLVLGLLNLQAQPVTNIVTYSKLDTVRAVEHLFAAKRTGGQIYLGVGLPLTLIGTTTAFLVTTLTATIKAGQGKEKAVPIIIASGGIGLVPGSMGLARRLRFGRSREQTILTAYQDNKSLPSWLQRQLKPKFFW